MDAKLGRKVLDHVTAHPSQFDMSTWGIERSCGTTACLAGWALLLSGRKLSGFEEYADPDGETVNITATARALLRLTPEEYYGDDGADATLFGEQPEEAAIARFRALVEAAEAAEGVTRG